MDNLPNVPYEYLINLALETGYPKVLNLCKTHTNFKKICDDNHFWTLLLLQDYYNIIGNYKFIDPKNTYIIIYKAFYKKHPSSIKYSILELAELASTHNNLDLLEVLFKKYKYYMNDPSKLSDMLILALKHGSFKTGTYLLLKNATYTDGQIMENLYQKIDNIEAKNILNIILNDNRISKDIMLIYAVKYSDIDTVISLLDNETIKIAFDKSIDYKNLEIITYLLNNYDISDESIENGIIELKGSQIKNNTLLQVLLKTNRYDPDKVFLQSTQTNSKTLDILVYLLKHKNINLNILNSSAINTVKYCNMDILDLLLSQKDFEPLFDNAIIFSEAYYTCISVLVDKLVTYDNYDKIFISIIDKRADNTIFDTLLNSKFFEKKNDKNQKILEKALKLLIHSDIVDENKVVIILSVMNKIDDNVKNELSHIACIKNFRLILDSLLNFDLSNINELFNLALDNGNIFLSIMVSNYNICDYINDKRIMKFMKKSGMVNCHDLSDFIEDQYIQLIKNLIGVFLFKDDNGDIMLDGNAMTNFINKYSTNLNEDNIENILADHLNYQYNYSNNSDNEEF